MYSSFLSWVTTFRPLLNNIITSLSTKTLRDKQYAELRNKLIYDKNAPRSDMEGIYGTRSELSKARQGIIRSILRSRKLLRWFTDKESSVLLLNAEGHSSDRKDISEAAAFTCARIAFYLEDGSIASNSDSVPLYFFCGKHPHSKDPKRNSPIEIANSFIGQLLQRFKDLDLTAALNLKPVQGLRSTLNAMTVFETLLAQLPASVTVYLIIEDITCYHCDDQLIEYTSNLVCRLDSLIQKPPMGITCRIKLLLTSSGQVPPNVYCIGKSNVLNIPVKDESEPGEKAFDNAWDNLLDVRR